jgi:hypothetical protein
MFDPAQHRQGWLPTEVTLLTGTVTAYIVTGG